MGGNRASTRLTMDAFSSQETSQKLSLIPFNSAGKGKARTEKSRPKIVQCDILETCPTTSTHLSHPFEIGDELEVGSFSASTPKHCG